MPGELGLLYEDMKDLRRRGEWTDTPSPRSESMSDAQRRVLTKLSDLLADETVAGKPQLASFARLVDVWALAERVFGDASKAEIWLHRPNPSLATQRPIDLLTDDLGTAVVRETLERIDHGIFA